MSTFKDLPAEEKVSKWLATVLVGSDANMQWYAAALSQFAFGTTSEVPTMALTMSFETLQPKIVYNVKFVKDLDFPEFGAILIHELWHFLNRSFMRQEFRDPTGWNFATDSAMNWHIERDFSHKPLVQLPDNCLQAPKEMKQEDVYSENLYKVTTGQGKDKQSGQPGAGSPLEQAWDDFQAGKTKLVDDHSLWGTFNDVPEEAIGNKVVEIIDNATRFAGSEPHGAAKILRELLESKVPWGQLLRRFAGDYLKIGSRPSWKRYNRRMGESQPGKIIKRGGKLVILVDTSGSTAGDQAQFWGEIDFVARSFETWVIQCDAAVQGKPIRYHRGVGKSLEIKDYGGTDMNPGIEAAKKLKPDLFVCFTDGYLFGEPVPTGKPELWVICQNGVEVKNRRCIIIESKDK